MSSQSPADIAAGEPFLCGERHIQKSRVRFGRLSARLAASRLKRVCCINATELPFQCSARTQINYRMKRTAPFILSLQSVETRSTSHLAATGQRSRLALYRGIQFLFLLGPL